jgi:ribosomal protein S3
MMILVHCARPGVLIGRKGVKVDKLKGELES